mgnify:CR=1 FL=1
MLDQGSDGTSELQAPANLGVRRLDFIDSIKARLEAACPATVSCADVIAMAGRDAVFLSGGPDFGIPLGRLDGFQASAAVAQSSLPPATISVSAMLALFGRMGMNLPESVAILGQAFTLLHPSIHPHLYLHVSMHASVSVCICLYVCMSVCVRMYVMYVCMIVCM